MGTHLRKWLWDYRLWTWGPLAVVIAVIVMIVNSVIGSGGAWFVLALTLSLITLGAYSKLAGDPPKWVAAIAISFPLILWGAWALNPVWYGEWKNSRFYLFMLVAAVVIGWLSTMKAEPAVKPIRTVLILLVLGAVAYGAYGKFTEWRGSATSDYDAVIPIRLEQNRPFIITVKERHQLDLWNDDTVGAPHISQVPVGTAKEVTLSTIDARPMNISYRLFKCTRATPCRK
jgi:hypothetical protein